MPFDGAFWNEKFDDDTYLYGKTPASFLVEHASVLAPGSQLLVPADGEGRNSVFLASQGHQVLATDFSDNGLSKARALAESEGVHVEHRQLDLFEWDWPEAAFDAVVAIFIQFAGPAGRHELFGKIQQAVRPGGLVLLHGYTPEQLAHGTGGPPIEENLYTPELLAASFAGWELLRLEAYERLLSEGTGHSGTSALIDLIARRPQ